MKKNLRITVEGKTYDVLVEQLDDATPVASARAPVAPTPAAAPAAAMAPNHTPAPTMSPAPATKTPAGAGDVASPLAGKVVSIDVSIGQTVNEGTQVATLEAMKMNTYIYASTGGKVTAVLVAPGDAVEEGTALVKLA